MKKGIIVLLVMGRILTAFGQETAFQVEGMGSATLPVTVDKMTNIIFPGPIQSAVKVTRDVLAQKVKGVENVIELKAIRRGFPPTNLSVYGRDGRLYSFVLKYVADTAVLNYRVVLPDVDAGAGIRVAGLPVDGTKLQADAEQLASQHGFLHEVCRSGRLRFRMEGIWLRDSLQWFVFSVSNESVVAYRPVRLRFYLVDAERISRRAEQEVEVNPVYTGPAGYLPGYQSEHFAIGFEPFTVPKGKRLVVALQGQDGRMLVLRVKGGVVLHERAMLDQ